MKKKIFMLIIVLFSFFVLENVYAATANEIHYCDNSKYTKRIVHVKFWSGFETNKKAKQAQMSLESRKMIYNDTSDDSSGPHMWSFDRDTNMLGGDAHGYYNIESNGLARWNAYHLSRLSNVVVDGIEYEFDGWYYDAEYKEKVTAETTLDLDLERSRGLYTYGCQIGSRIPTSVGTFFDTIWLHAKWKRVDGQAKPQCTEIPYNKRTDLVPTVTGRSVPRLRIAYGSENKSANVTPTATTFSGSTDSWNLSNLYNSDKTLSIPSSTEKNGYRFEGYYYDPLFTEPVPSSLKYKDVIKWIPNASDVNGCPVSYGSVYVYAKWSYIEDEIQTDSIEVNLANNLGYSSRSTVTISKNSATYESLPKPYKEGFVFEGWYYDGKFQKEVVGTTTKDLNINKLTYVYDYNGVNGKKYYLFAKWAREYSDNGVKISGVKNSLNGIKTFKANTLNGIDNSSLISSNNIVKYKAYDVNIYSSETQTMQPDGRVRLGIEIPNGYDKNKLKIYYYDGNRLVESELSVIEDGYAYTYVTHFSTYLLAETGSNTGSETNTVDTTKSDDTSLVSLSVDGYQLDPTFSPSERSYYVTVPSNVSSITIRAQANPKATILNNVFECDAVVCGVKVTAENGNVGYYYISVLKNNGLNTDARLKTVSTLGKTISINDNNSTYNLVLDSGTSINSSNITFTYTAYESTTRLDSNTCDISDLSLNGFVNCRLVSRAQDTSYTKEYTIRVSIDGEGKSKENRLLSLEANVDGTWSDDYFDPDINMYTFMVSNNVNSVELTAKPLDSKAKIKGGNIGEAKTISCENLKVGSNKCNIEVISESNDTNTYSVYIVRSNTSSDSTNQYPIISIVINNEKNPMTVEFENNEPVYKYIVPYEIGTVGFEVDGHDIRITNGITCTLSVGENNCPITISSTETKTYKAVVTRLKEGESVPEEKPINNDNNGSKKPQSDEKNPNSGSFAFMILLTLSIIGVGFVVLNKFVFKNKIYKI